MVYILQLALVFLVWQAGELISKVFSLFVPGPIVGMLILFVLLQTKLLQEKHIKKAGDLILEILPFFFIPSGVAIVGYTHLLAGVWPKILATLILSVAVTMLVSGRLTQYLLIRKSKVKDGESVD